jgi:hypothetical protein
MYKKIIWILVFALLGLSTMVTPLLADDYYLYVNWNPGVNYTTGINGYVDTAGAIEGIPDAEYLFFTGGPSYGGNHTAYIYRVETAGDPNMHPDNPDATGPIAPRTFTLVSSHYLGNYSSGHENAFYVDHTGIYYGAAPGWGGIFHWDFDWNPLGWVVSTPAPGGAQTLARNPATGHWWVGTGNRNLYRWDGSSWVYQFTYPNLGGDHHDGMEIIGNSLFISDMTSDVIIQYRLDDSGNSIDPPGSPYKTFTYSAGPPVEGMGYGPNKHIWISGWNSYTIYEIGGGELQIALEGIPDQCIPAGDAFDTFDLDDYVVGLPPFTWTWAGNVNLTISVDDSNVVTVTYPDGWWGEETVTFTVTDGLGRSASDDATFTVDPVPIVGDIPNQSAPFVPFDLDDYLSGIDPTQVTWTVSGMNCLVVDIDPITHVATVTNPGEVCTEPETITFTATATACDDTVSDEDEVIFTPIIPVAIDIKPQSCPNPLNTKSKGVLPVAILGTEDFDVITVDPATVLLEGVAPLRWSFEDVSTPVDPEADTCECTTEGADGYMDMTLKFDTQSIVAALGMVEDGEVRVLALTGMTYDGMPIEGKDCVVIIHKGPAKLSAETPTEFSLSSNYPNPFNPTTSITFTLPFSTNWSLKIYNVAGQLVKSFEGFSSDEVSIIWNGTDNSGDKVSSGIYFYKLSAGDFIATKRMVMLK